MASGGVRVEGLAELRRGLKNLDPDLAKALRGELKAIGDKVANDARDPVPVGKTGAAARSVRSGVSGNTAYVAGGKSTVPYFGWLDFGTRNPRTGKPRTVGPWKKSGTGPRKGRFIYPAINKNDKYIRKQAGAAFDKAAKNLK